MRTYTSAIIILVIILPVVVYLIKQIQIKRRKRKLLRTIEEIADLRQLELLEIDYFRNKILAFDQNRSELIYLDLYNAEDNAIIKFREVKGCDLILKELSIQLEVVFDTPQRQPITIPFYRKYIDPFYQRKSLTETSRKWEEIISQALSY